MLLLNLLNLFIIYKKLSSSVQYIEIFGCKLSNFISYQSIVARKVPFSRLYPGRFPVLPAPLNKRPLLK
jgi:hypothetical protein